MPPDYIKKINEFSSDISTASLDLGTKIMLPNSDSEGKDSVDLIRDSLFSIQVEQPWLLLQFGNSNAEEIGADRVEALVSASPEGRGRKDQRGSRENRNRGQRQQQSDDTAGCKPFRHGILPTVLQFRDNDICILAYGYDVVQPDTFIIFAMFLPISFLLSMIPSYESMAKQAIVKGV